ncbi:hypothetical protein HG543_41695, partial [Pyxidicoccus fallax]|nr:hypothetical protein [Pyxidicoccus fallax]
MMKRVSRYRAWALLLACAMTLTACDDESPPAPDAGIPDAGVRDSGVPDSGAPDAGDAGPSGWDGG